MNTLVEMEHEIADLLKDSVAPVETADEIGRQRENGYRKLEGRAPVEYSPRHAMPTLPDYAVHREGTNEIGRLSAEAVVREYESAAKEIENTGAQLVERVRQCEAMTRNAMAVVGDMRATAAKYRAEAKRVFEQIEDCTLLTDEVRKTCTDLAAKIAGDGDDR